MDIHDLHNIGWCGSTLNVAERTLLEAGLVKRKLEEGLESVGFWGRVSGTDADYLVAVGRGPSKGYPRKKFYFCTAKAARLQALPDLTPAIAAKAAAVRGRLKGDPSLPLEAGSSSKEDDEPREKLVESHRLV
jgi:radial spoke head protein 9